MGFALVLEVLGEIDRGHTAGADLFLDGVPVGEGRLEPVKKVWHCVLALLATVLEYGFGSYMARQGEDEPTSSRDSGINIRSSL